MEKEKAAFMAQYYGQNVCEYQDLINNKRTCHVNHFGSHRIKESILLLRSISQLTDEELIKVTEMWGYKREYAGSDPWMCRQAIDILKIFTSKRDSIHGALLVQLADYLRSIGILIPFRGMSVDELIEKGWAKIKED